MMRFKKFAPYFLFFAIMAGVISLISFFITDNQNQLSLVFFGFTLILTFFYVLIDPSRILHLFSKSEVKNVNNSFITFIAILGILIVINSLANGFNFRVDLTQDRTYTLSPETKSILASLPYHVEIQAFFSANLPTEEVSALLESYRFASHGMLDFEFINPDNDPLAAQEANVVQDGTLVLHMNGIMEQVVSISEEQISSALNRLIFPGERVVYFLTGHGEGDPTGVGSNPYTHIDNLLIAKNYSVSTLNLISNTQVPDDASVVIVAGPLQTLQESEIQELSAYLDDGGAVVFLLEPLGLTDFPRNDNPLLNYLSENWGVVLTNNLVYDQNISQAWGAVSDPRGYATHPITSGLSGSFVLFYTATALQQSNPLPDNISQVILAVTDQATWGETNIASINQQSYSFDDADVPGPVNLALAITNTDTGGRVVVIGDSEFANDQFVLSFKNSDFMINVIDWAAAQESMINLTPQTSIQRVMFSPTREAMNLVFSLSVIAVPLFVTIIGIFVWVLRRKYRS